MSEEFPTGRRRVDVVCYTVGLLELLSRAGLTRRGSQRATLGDGSVVEIKFPMIMRGRKGA